MPFEIGPGLTWNRGTTRCDFVRMSNSGGILTGLVKRGDEYEELPLAELACEIVLETWAARPDLQERADDDWMIAGLSDTAHAEMRRRLTAVMEVTTGLRPGKPARPEYDLLTTTKTQRVERKAVEELVSTRTVQRWIEAHDDSGDAGLVHGNRHLGTAADLHDPDVVQIALALVEEELTRSDKSQQNLVGLLNRRLRDKGQDTLSVYQASKLLDEVSRGMSLRGSAKTSKSKASRPKGGRGHARPTVANEVWEIDSFRLDVLAYSPLTKMGVPAYAVTIVDVCTRVLSAYVSLTPPSATTVALALHRRMNPLLLDRSMTPAGPAIPHAVLTVEDSPLVHPGGIPGEIHADHGADYENQMVLSLLATLGIDLILARPRTGSDKPHVESAIRTLNHTVMQLLPGYKGRSADHRGDHPHRESLATLDQLKTIMDGYCLAYNNTPHTGLAHPGQLGTYQTPMEAYTASVLAGAPPRMDADVNLVFRFMPTKTAVVSGRGPSIDGIVYTSEDTEVMRRISAGDRHVPGRPLAFHHDPSDRSHVYWHEPGTARWHELTAQGRDDEAIPPLSDEFYQRALDTGSHRRPNKQHRADAALAIADEIHRVLTTTDGAKALRREFSRWQERLQRHASTTPPGAAHGVSKAKSGRHRAPRSGTTGEAPVLDLDLDAYVEEVEGEFDAETEPPDQSAAATVRDGDEF
ncbi:DDE-type integrase/transposase/recombinase [Nocardioides glacieisoli]|uniref:DDE-type integrase/transposase/recombinase n=1 Tax=Nocardioides glacieisoli TaxID=1168730 RepID=UPI0013ECA8A5|nr:DDE-type integrase/transposase/recombinase [Nocardioides glacieisoli]